MNNATLKDGFAGNRRFFKGFLAKMELIFMVYPDRYADDETKIVYVISRLYGDAMNWAASLIENNDECLLNYDSFIAKFKSVFGNNDSTFIANQKLRTIKQRRIGDIQNYILEFNRYSDDSSWNENAKMDAFLAGLQDQIANRILEMFPGPQTLLNMQTIASRIDSRINSNRQFFSGNRQNNSNSNRKFQVNKKPFSSRKKKTYGPLSKEERERRIKENLCLYCGDPGHKLEDCPKKKKTSGAHISNSASAKKPRPRFSDDPNLKQPVVEFNLNTSDVSVKAKLMIDSGSQLNLIDVVFAEENNIPYEKSSPLNKISGIGGEQPILGRTLAISMTYKNHKCKTIFNVVDLPGYCGILGAEWLQEHNPNIDFVTKELSFKSNFCLSNCIMIPNVTPTYAINSVSNESQSSCSNSENFNSSKDNYADTINLNIQDSFNENIKHEITLPKELTSFKDVFDEKAAEKLPPHRPYDCEIRLKPGSKLFYGPIYPLTDKESTVLKEYIDDNLRKGFIKPSKSPAGAPVLFVPKKNGELRLCQDYRKLNEITIRDSYPLPLINDMLEHLGKSNIFSKLDLRSAYNLVRIKEGDEFKTAFTCKYGHFEYTVMPFGLKNAPAVFQHFINDVLEGILGVFVYSYIDDLIIFSPNYTVHITHVSEVLTRLRKAGLYAKLEKCEFFVPFIDFLGHRISSEGILMDPKKVSSILEWPIPKSVKEVQSFLGLANYYRRFIAGFADLAQPLNSLLKKDVKFNFSPTCEDSFTKIKSKFASAPVLAYPNREIPFMVETDASNFAIGAILSQKNPDDKVTHPVAFFSRSLSSSERNYPIYDKELLAIVAALENWRHLLKGTNQPFKIFSDHRNLLYQKKPEKMTQRLVRWSLFLAEFNFVIVYRSGSANGKPDALSRRPDYLENFNDSKDTPTSVFRPENFCAIVVENNFLLDKIISVCKDDKFYFDVCKYLETQIPPIPHSQIENFKIQDGVLLFNERIYVPQDCRLDVLKICHDSPSAGHFGIKKTTSLVVRDFWWPYLSKDVKEYIRSCDTCCRSKDSRHKPYGFLSPLEISERPWSSLSMDFVTDLPPSNNYTCIFVVNDRLTRMSHFIPFENVPSASATADAFMKYIFKYHGLPDEIISDRGTQFTSNFWKSVCKTFDITLKFSSSYHHQTNGLTERVNSVIEQYLRCYSNYKGSDWYKFLHFAEFSYNNAVQESTKVSPFFANYGYNPKHSPVLPSHSNIPRADEFTTDFKEIIKTLKENLKKSIEKQEKFANKHRIEAPEFKVNDKVWINSSLIMKNGNKKLKPKKLGPYKIIKKISPVSYKLDLPKEIRIHPVIHVSELEPYFEDKFKRNQPPPPPIIVDNEEEFEVEEILDKRKYY
eukprot:jgi/Orpsp1_1/1180416/evm.model.c7180000073352.1